MKYARIENGEVREIIDFNPKGYFVKNIEEQFVECNEDTEQHDIIVDNKFIKPIPKIHTQEELNQIILNEINEEHKGLLRLVEDISEFLEELGFEIPLAQKERILNIKEKRKQLK